mmetsp:Transcript_9320/g.19610  ORF Transcript_9320/g.19610 Transcript_9320/m.19610 type:complete len:661 (+) Transcript_9320:310-2292(+)
MASPAPRKRRGRIDASSWISPLPVQQFSGFTSLSSFEKKSSHASTKCTKIILRAKYFFCAAAFFISLAMFFAAANSSLPVPSEGTFFGNFRSTRRKMNLKSVTFRGSGPTGKKSSIQKPYIKMPNNENANANEMYDVAIVGCGPAGLTAALFASRIGLSVLVIGSPSAGSLAGTDQLDNFPSYLAPGLGNGVKSRGGGLGWLDATMIQAYSSGAKFVPPMWFATGIERREKSKKNPKDNDGSEISKFVFEVGLSSKALGDGDESFNNSRKIHAKSVIIATGSNPRRLNLPHENTLWGHSLHNCALCDGDKYVTTKTRIQRTDESTQPVEGKSVCVIGGGDAAAEAISLLNRLGIQTIHWIHRRIEFKASAVEVEKIRQMSNVQVWTPYVVADWVVDDYVDEKNSTSQILTGVRVVGSKDGIADPEAASSLTIVCDGAFLMIGSIPNTSWLTGSGIDIDRTTGLILTPSDVEIVKEFSTSSSIPGIFAAGEAMDGIYRQALTASADGAKAAMDAERYLRRLGIVSLTNERTAPASKSGENDHAEENPTSPVDCDLEHVDCIKSVLLSHPVVVFSKPFCSYCRKAMEIIRSEIGEGIEPFVVDLTEIRDGWKVQDALHTLTGRRTVPNVFIGARSIGGGDETVELFREGKLRSLLHEAGAIK